MQHCGHKSVKKYFLLQLGFFPTPTDTMEGSLCLLLLAIIFFLQTPKQQDLLCLRSPIQSGCKKDFGGTGGGKTAAATAKAVCLHVLDFMFFEFYQYVSIRQCVCWGPDDTRRHCGALEQPGTRRRDEKQSERRRYRTA